MNYNDCKLPDPGPDELWKHVAKTHGANQSDRWQDIVSLAHMHLLAHVRGHFFGDIHFHEEAK